MSSFDAKIIIVGAFMQKPDLIFEDDELLVLNKPAGWVVNEAKTTGRNPVVQTWLKENFDYPISQRLKLRSGIVHRIDKETSGILLVAKTEEAFFKIQEQFKKRGVSKTYCLLVHGRMQPGEGEVDLPIGRLPWRRERFGVLAGGKQAVTDYKTQEYYRKGEDNYSLLLAYPKTGRTHQIRVHFKNLGFPIVADEFYAGRKTSREDRKWCPRLFLHASEIVFSHPKTGKEMHFKAKLPDDLKKVIGKLQEVGV